MVVGSKLTSEKLIDGIWSLKNTDDSIRIPDRDFDQKSFEFFSSPFTPDLSPKLDLDKAIDQPSKDVLGNKPKSTFLPDLSISLIGWVVLGAIIFIVFAKVLK